MNRGDGGGEVVAGRAVVDVVDVVGVVGVVGVMDVVSFLVSPERDATNEESSLTGSSPMAARTARLSSFHFADSAGQFQRKESNNATAASDETSSCVATR